MTEPLAGETNQHPVDVLSIRLFAARAYLKDAVLRWVLASFNFPSEAANAITALSTAMELVLREGKAERSANMFELVQAQLGWNREDRELVHWVRALRNKVLHAGDTAILVVPPAKA